MLAHFYTVANPLSNRSLDRVMAFLTRSIFRNSARRKNSPAKKIDLICTGSLSLKPSPNPNPNWSSRRRRALDLGPIERHREQDELMQFESADESGEEKSLCLRERQFLNESRRQVVKAGGWKFCGGCHSCREGRAIKVSGIGEALIAGGGG